MSETVLSNPPRPKGDFWFGNMRPFKRDPLGFMQQMAREHGDFVEMRLAYARTFLVNHPDFIADVLSRKAQHFDKNTRSSAKISSSCGAGLLSGDHEAWLRQRTLVQPVFQPRFIAAMEPFVTAHLDRFLVGWDRAATEGRPVDLVHDMLSLVSNIVAEVLFGDEVDAEQLQADLRVLIDDTWRRIGLFIDPADFSPFFHRSAFKRALASVDRMALSVISRRRHSGKPAHENVLDRLLEAHARGGQAGMNDRELRDATVTLLLAGHETTASALAWSLYHIAAEKGRDLSAEDPARLFREALRLHPSIWIIERRATSEVEVGPYRIPKGASILISPYVLHRHPAFWSDPDSFDPDRFDEKAVAGRPRNAYMPFGLGQHRCIGLHLAELIATRTLAAINRRFILRLESNETPRVEAKITLCHTGRIMTRLEPRPGA